jgi:hypothetical protein
VVPGPPGPDGAIGPAGPGVAAGGLIGEALFKLSAVDYDTGWAPAAGYDDTALVARVDALEVALAALEAALMPITVVDAKRYVGHQHAAAG